MRLRAAIVPTIVKLVGKAKGALGLANLAMRTAAWSMEEDGQEQDPNMSSGQHPDGNSSQNEWTDDLWWRKSCTTCCKQCCMGCA